MSKRCILIRAASSACYLIICFSVALLQRMLWKFWLEGRINKDLSLHSQCCFIILFPQKKAIVSFLQKKKNVSLSAEMRLGEQNTVFFHISGFFFWNAFRWMEPFLKYSRLKCIHRFSRLGPFILFCFFLSTEWWQIYHFSQLTYHSDR